MLFLITFSTVEAAASTSEPGVQSPAARYEWRGVRCTTKRVAPALSLNDVHGLHDGYELLSLIHSVTYFIFLRFFIIGSGTKTVVQLRGAYGTVVLNEEEPEHLIVARSGSPLVIGYAGVGENFLCFRPTCIIAVTRRFAYSEEGDVAEITRRTVDIYDREGTIRQSVKFTKAILRQTRQIKDNIVTICKKRFLSSRLRL